jgi:hypothetical protein
LGKVLLVVDTTTGKEHSMKKVTFDGVLKDVCVTEVGLKGEHHCSWRS